MAGGILLQQPLGLVALAAVVVDSPAHRQGWEPLDKDLTVALDQRQPALVLVVVVVPAG
jgi:hypothetical protein